MNLGCDSIYVINLKRHKVRKNGIKKIAKEYNLNINYIDAIDNRDFLPTWDERKLNNFTTPVDKKLYNKIANKFWDPNGLLSVGIICCALSHRKAYEKFLESGDEIGLFLEDDVYATKFIKEYNFKKIRNELKNQKWGVCWYGKYEHEIEHKLEKVSSNLYKIQSFIPTQYAAHAYLLNRKSAKWFYDRTEKIEYAADIRLEINPWKQLCLNNSIFIQTHMKAYNDNKKIDNEYYHWTREDYGDYDFDINNPNISSHIPYSSWAKKALHIKDTRWDGFEIILRK